MSGKERILSQRRRRRRTTKRGGTGIKTIRIAKWKGMEKEEQEKHGKKMRRAEAED